MDNINFFSSSRYIYLPTKNNPKVALCVDSSLLVENAFKLYNPFSFKAKIFKEVSKFSFILLNPLLKLCGSKEEEADFIPYLEELLGQSIISSIYFATAQDKVVLQLQSLDAKVIGYLKYPLNEMGIKHIENEIKAIKILSKLGIIDDYILTDNYHKKPFVILKELDGKIGDVAKVFLDKILLSLEKENSYPLLKHPRVLKLKELLTVNGMTKYTPMLETICNSSSSSYKVVYEHGDFAPWNIIEVKNSFIPFDFEYFVEDGLEYFDILKYYYQIGRLLEGKTGVDLFDFINININIKEIKEMFMLFLIKEILRLKEEKQVYEFEQNMIKIMEKI